MCEFLKNLCNDALVQPAVLPHLLSISDMLKEAQWLPKMWSLWPVAVLHWWVTGVLTKPLCNHACIRTCKTPIQDPRITERQQIYCLICLYSFQSNYIQNKSEELNQEQKNLKKKTVKRKSRDTETSKE